jgi:hypothetical protein
MVTVERLREILDYDSETGIFRYKQSTSDRMRVGDVAGWKARGYVKINISYETYRAHHLAWMFVHGEFPADEIDHIDGDRSNNAISNLRLATRGQNACNIRLRSDNRSGLKGVSWDKNRGKWLAQIKANRKNFTLGRFDTPEQAHAAWATAAKRLHGEFFNPGGRRQSDASWLFMAA